MNRRSSTRNPSHFPEELVGRLNDQLASGIQFSSESTMPPPEPTTPAPQPRLRTIMLWATLAGALLGGIAAFHFGSKSRWVATATVEVKSVGPTSTYSATWFPDWIRNVLPHDYHPPISVEAINGDGAMLRVVRSGRLPWSRGMTEADALARLKSSLSVHGVRGTDLVDLSLSAPDEQTALEAARVVADVVVAGAESEWKRERERSSTELRERASLCEREAQEALQHWKAVQADPKATPEDRDKARNEHDERRESWKHEAVELMKFEIETSEDWRSPVRASPMFPEMLRPRAVSRFSRPGAGFVLLGTMLGGLAAVLLAWIWGRIAQARRAGDGGRN